MKRIVIVGGGITGLSTAWLLAHGLEDGSAPADVAVTLCEAGPRLGGKIHTATHDGLSLDVGADAFLNTRPEATRLARRLGLGDDLVAPMTSQVWLWVRGELRPLPAGTVLGAPADFRALARSGVLPPMAMLRAVAEPLVPSRPLVSDRSVGDLVAERYGRAVTDLLVEPLLGGVYAGRADRLSVMATAPPLAAAAEEGGSLWRALRRRRRRPGGEPVFYTLRGGLSRLVRGLADDLGDTDTRTETAVTALSRTDDGWRVGLDGGGTIVADEVVLTVPAHVAALLVRDLAPAAAVDLAGIEYASVAVVTLAYPRSAGAHLDGSGMLVPPAERRTLKAATWSSRKWPHLDDPDRFLVRASVGRIDDDAALAATDETLAARVARELQAAMDLTAEPLWSKVTRWPRALPQYAVGHRERVGRIRGALAAAAPGLHVAGAAYDGLGIAPCVGQAETLVRELRGGA